VSDASSPLVIGPPQDATRWVKGRIASGRSVALVPTMGALHEGHLALVRRARDLADDVVVSIFVNPTQFGPSEDFQKYPRTFEDDLRGLRAERVAMVFAPTAGQMYAGRCSTTVSPPEVASPLEGICRPGHFQGVCTVVMKLFQIIPAQVAVFGQKDYQQARVITDMVADLNVDVTIDVLPTVRDPDGLALSSRNRYLPSNVRHTALSLSRALNCAAELYKTGQSDSMKLEEAMRSVLVSSGVDSIDYAAVVDPETLLPLVEPLPLIGADGLQPPAGDRSPVAVCLIAARVAGTRLIDNRLLFPG
jgi:pantoate--beta-alanine ligase